MDAGKKLKGLTKGRGFINTGKWVRSRFAGTMGGCSIIRRIRWVRFQVIQGKRVASRIACRNGGCRSQRQGSWVIGTIGADKGLKGTWFN